MVLSSSINPGVTVLGGGSEAAKVKPPSVWLAFGKLWPCRNIMQEHSDIVEQLTAKIEDWKARALEAALPEGDDAEAMSAEELERLRSLGYIQ